MPIKHSRLTALAAALCLLLPLVSACAGTPGTPTAASVPAASVSAASITDFTQSEAVPAVTSATDVPTGSDAPTAAPAGADTGIVETEELLDISAATPTAAYAVLFQMAIKPEKYAGKNLRVKGLYKSYYDAERDIQYMAVFCSDETMCCSQGVYLVMDAPPPPETLPPDGSIVTAEGLVEPYTMEDGTPSCHLIHTELLEVLPPV